MKENEENLSDIYQRANDYAHRIMQIIREEHEREIILDPELRKFEGLDYDEGVKQFREMALHYLKQSPENEPSLENLTPDEFADTLLSEEGFPNLSSAHLHKPYAPK